MDAFNQIQKQITDPYKRLAMMILIGGIEGDDGEFMTLPDTDNYYNSSWFEYLCSNLDLSTDFMVRLWKGADRAKCSFCDKVYVKIRQKTLCPECSVSRQKKND